MVETIRAVGRQLVIRGKENSGNGGLTTTYISLRPFHNVEERSEVSIAVGVTDFVMDYKKTKNGVSSASSLETTPVPSESQKARVNFKFAPGDG